MVTRKRLALAAIVLVGLSYATLIQSFSWNQTSHYDLIRALNNGSTTIDANQQNTGDKVFYRGHWYSARAPGLALFALPFYDALNIVDADRWASESPAQRDDDEMVYLIGLWSNVLPGLLLLLLVWRVAERFEPGYGASAAVALGLGTMVLPLSTLLFSHVFTAFLGFGAFALMLRERDGPASPMLLALAGLAMGYAVGSEYPLFFVALVLGLYLLSRRDALNPLGVLRRAGAYIAGGLVGIVPLLLYNHYAFRSWTHLAYSDVPRQKKGFFGIVAPSLKVLSTLLFDSRGLLTISPVLVLGAMGTVLLYKRSKRAEALTIAGVCLCYVGYNSGYYLPFGGGFMGPRFLTTMLPFLAFPLAIAFKRWPGPTVGLAAVSITTTVVATITHPLVGYETEVIVWARYLREGFFQPTIASAYGLGRGWGAIWPFLLAAGGAVALAAWATPRLRLSGGSLAAGALAVLGWGAFAALAPTILGLDHQGLLDIQAAGDPTALHKGFGSYPLRTLAPLAAIVGLLALALARLLRYQPPPEPGGPLFRAPRRRRRRKTAAALTALLVLMASLGVAVASAHGGRSRSAPTRPGRASPRAALAGTTGGQSGGASGVCHRLRQASGPLSLPATRKRLTVLATGDSMIYPIDQELGVEAPRGVRVVSDRRDGTGLTTSTVDWPRLARRQVARLHPNAVVISLGGRDGGFPLRDPHHHLVACCGARWLALYAARVQPLIESYVQAGRAHVYWLLLPAPREAARAPLYEAVNNAIRLLAARFPTDLTLIGVDSVISPGAYQEAITYEGVEVHPRAPDGIHLDHEGACVERSLVVAAMRGDGQLLPALVPVG
jgi:hypothetical protein